MSQANLIEPTSDPPGPPEHDCYQRETISELLADRGRIAAELGRINDKLGWQPCMVPHRDGHGIIGTLYTLSHQVTWLVERARRHDAGIAKVESKVEGAERQSFADLQAVVRQQAEARTYWRRYAVIAAVSLTVGVVAPILVRAILALF